MSFVKSFVEDEQGQDLVEYSLLLAFIGLGTVAALTTVKNQVNTLWNTINTKLSTANTTATNGR